MVYGKAATKISCEKDGFNPWDTRVVGDWDGEGKKNMGIYINGQWILERNGNAVWDDFDYYYREFLKENYSIDYPIVGDWNGDGRDKAGIFRNGYWYLDKNGNGNWDGCDVDICLGPFAGEPGDIPIIGDWTGNGRSKIGTYRNGYWYLDYNENGNWDGCEVDLCLGPFCGKSRRHSGCWRLGGVRQIGDRYLSKRGMGFRFYRQRRMGWVRRRQVHRNFCGGTGR